MVGIGSRVKTVFLYFSVTRFVRNFAGFCFFCVVFTILYLLWQNFHTFGQTIIVINGQILKKESSHLVTLTDPNTTSSGQAKTLRSVFFFLSYRRLRHWHWNSVSQSVSPSTRLRFGYKNQFPAAKYIVNVNCLGQSFFDKQLNASCYLFYRVYLQTMELVSFQKRLHWKYIVNVNRLGYSKTRFTA